MPRFGKDRDAHKEELDRQAAEEVERLTRRGGPPGMGGMPGMPGMGGAPHGPPSPLEMMAEEVRDAPRPSQRRQAPRRAAPRPQQAFTPLPSGEVGSSFGPGGLNPGPRGMAPAAPPPAFGGGAYDEDYGGPVDGPPVYYAEPDEDEEMSITEMALIDQAARTGHNPEDLVMRYDASSAEEMRDAAMRQFYERQQRRGPTAGTNNPFAPAGMRGRGSGPAPIRRDDPKSAGGALAQRIANKKRREEEEARRAQAASAPAARAGGDDDDGNDDGALSRVLARRRQSLGVDRQPEPQLVEEEEYEDDEKEVSAAPGRRHATARMESSPGLRAVPLQPVVDEDAPGPEEAAAAPTRRPAKKPAAAKKAAPAAAKKTAAAKAKASTTGKTTAKASASKAATKGPAKKKAGATLVKAAPAKAVKAAPAKAAKAPAAKKAKAPAAKKTGPKRTGAAKTVFCIECGEKNPAIAKFCFNCGTRLAAPEP